MRKKYLIYMDGFDPASGGVVALHKLCHDLRELGEDAYITSAHTHERLNAPFMKDAIDDWNDWIVIYPEIIHGNPANAKHVVRWILNSPGKCGGTKEGFYNNLKPEDLVFKYSPFFDCEASVRGMLRTSFIDYECFQNRSLERDIDSCFFVNKGGMPNQCHESSSMNFSPFRGDWDKASNILNRCRKFICYDNECFWVTLAALCGCPSVVIPNTNLAGDEWRSHFPFSRYGVAFGNNEFEYAKETLPLVKDHCKTIQAHDLEGVVNLIRICNSL